MLEAPKLKQGVDSSRISAERGQSKDVLVVVIDTAHHKLGVDLQRCAGNQSHSHKGLVTYS